MTTRLNSAKPIFKSVVYDLFGTAPRILLYKLHTPRVLYALATPLFFLSKIGGAEPIWLKKYKAKLKT